MERGADGANTGYCFPDMLCDVVRLAAAGRREAAHDLFDAHLPLLRYEQQPGVGLAVRKYVLMRRGILASRRAAAARAPRVARRRAPRSTTCSRASPGGIRARRSRPPELARKPGAAPSRCDVRAAHAGGARQRPLRDPGKPPGEEVDEHADLGREVAAARIRDDDVRRRRGVIRQHRHEAAGPDLRRDDEVGLERDAQRPSAASAARNCPLFACAPPPTRTLCSTPARSRKRQTLRPARYS